jgi:two-component system response regulator PilR (NtrC family)
LVVDDEPDLRELVALTLQRMGVESVTAATLAEARAALRSTPFDLCLTDMRLPDGDGLELVADVQKHRPNLPIAVITAHGSVEAAVQALKSGAFDFVAKPVQLGQLRALVQTALKLAGAHGSTSGAPRLTGDSRAMREVRELLARVARTQAPVLITGESGTGKELAAKLVHESGPRADAPFVAVNCGAIPAELIESELFGHRRGSFTGAVADKQGLFQAAHGGTLFLDEVADLPLALQVKLLRVVQEKAVRPVGATAEEPVDVRILAATHKDLVAQVAAGRFREDLYYRIVVVEVHIPPLRERREDLMPLAEQLLARLARAQGRAGGTLGPGARDALMAHEFPGNVRELENVLERALTLAGDEPIGAEHIVMRRAAAAAPAAADLEGQLADVERDAIRGALSKTGNNRTAAAKLLGMTLRQLRYRIAKLGLSVGGE